jgi:hypothetical protein
MSTAVKELPASTNENMPHERDEQTARTVIQLPKHLRAALRFVAVKRSVDMGDLVAEALLTMPAVKAAYEEILRDEGGEPDTKRRGK